MRIVGGLGVFVKRKLPKKPVNRGFGSFGRSLKFANTGRVCPNAAAMSREAVNSLVRSLRLDSIRTLYQFLHAPIHNLGNVEFVFRRAAISWIDPNCLGCFPARPRTPKIFPSSVDLMRPGSASGIQHLIRPWRDADGSWRAGMLAAGGFRRRDRAAHPRSSSGRNRNIEFDLAK